MQTNSDQQVDEKPKLRPKRVRCVETGEEFPSLIEAADSIGVHVAILHEACGVQRKICKGLTWVYVDKHGDAELQKPERGWHGRPVVRTMDGKRYPCMKVAAEIEGVTPSKMHRAIKKGEPISGSLWKFEE